MEPEELAQIVVEKLKDETGRLRLILTLWVKYNKKHNEKFSKWIEKANNLEGNPIYNSAVQATQEMEKSTNCCPGYQCSCAGTN